MTLISSQSQNFTQVNAAGTSAASSVTFKFPNIFSLKGLTALLALSSGSMPVAGNGLRGASGADHLQNIEKSVPLVNSGRDLLKSKGFGKAKPKGSSGTKFKPGVKAGAGLAGGSSKSFFSRKLEVGKGDNEVPLLFTAEGLKSYTVFNEVLNVLNKNCGANWDLSSIDQIARGDIAPLGYQKEVAGAQSTGDLTHTTAEVLTTTQSKLELLQSINPQGNKLTDADLQSGAPTMFDCINNAVDQGIKSDSSALRGQLFVAVSAVVIGALAL